MSAKFAGPATPLVAVTVKLPEAELAKALVDAMPAASVTAVGVVKKAEAPVSGAAKATVTPARGVPPASDTVARSGAANAV